MRLWAACMARHWRHAWRVTGGEIAELGGRIGGYGDGMHFNWCATAVGYFPEGRESLTGLQIAAGDVVLALRSPGLRSNGFSLARQILARRLGDSWHAVAGPEGKTWGEILLTPSLIYAPHLYDLLKSGVDVHGFAHVTGGGIPDNLGRILRASGCGATIGDTLPPEDFFLVLQEWGGIPDRLLYHSWNMNHGMLVILPEAALNGASRFLADAGFDSRAIGRITSSPGIVIASRGREGGEIRYERSGK